jgi:hypothetical protein
VVDHHLVRCHYLTKQSEILSTGGIDPSDVGGVHFSAEGGGFARLPAKTLPSVPPQALLLAALLFGVYRINKRLTAMGRKQRAANVRNGWKADTSSRGAKPSRPA